jgi:DNA repair photolyase
VELFAEHPGLVIARIGLVSTSPRYRNVFEPFAASGDERLKNIDRLKAAGVDVKVRIDPIIPFYTDDESSIERLYESLAARDVRKVTLSYLHLRPAILHQLERELPIREFQVLRSCFETQPWTVVGASTRSKLVPARLRQRGYERFSDLAKAFGLRTLICSCKNPDMPAQRCSTGTSARKLIRNVPEKPGQLSLFPC